jgi:hypothetical protein
VTQCKRNQAIRPLPRAESDCAFRPDGPSRSCSRSLLDNVSADSAVGTGCLVCCYFGQQFLD